MKSSVCLNLLFAILFAHLTAFGQQPQGKLYVSGFNTDSLFQDYGVLGYFDFPSLQFHHIDSVEAIDILVHNNLLYAVTSTAVNIYDLNTNQLTDSIDVQNVQRFAAGGQRLLISTHSPPKLGVYDTGNNHQLVFSVDTPMLGGFMNDMCISGDTAYLLGYPRTLAYDLSLQDSIQTIRDTALQYSWYTKCLSHGDYVYMVIAAPTAAPREGMQRLRKSDLTVEDVLPADIKPKLAEELVMADQKIYAWGFPTYYDLVTDTLMMSYNTNETTVAYDDLSEALITYKSTGVINQSMVQYYDKNRTRLDSVPFMNRIGRARWKQEAPVSLEELPASGLAVYPNPANEQLNVRSEMDGKAVIVDLSGKVIVDGIELKSDQNIGIPVHALSPGVYFLKFEAKKSSGRLKFVKF